MLLLEKDYDIRGLGRLRFPVVFPQVLTVTTSDEVRQSLYDDSDLYY